MDKLTQINHCKMFDGHHERYQHFSDANQCTMTFAIYLPPATLHGKKVPVLYWLSGLTCTDENFATKAHAQQFASQHGIALVMPDTSPRGDGVADDDAYDLGQGAGFYVNATQEPWAKHYQMYDYVVHELPKIIESHFPVTNERAIFGHSMGGHGALQIALKNSHRYKSVSAFAPIVNPSDTPWGKKAFSAYLGSDAATWSEYDSLQLLDKCTRKDLPILIDQGLADSFYPEQLQPEKFTQKANELGFDATLHLRSGYNHSYYFIASFIREHIEFHAKTLKG